MSQHTKWPWQVEEGFSVVGTRRTVTEYFVRRDGDSIAIAADILDPKTGEPSEANARLIAAAPQLLEALEACQWNGRNCMDEPRCPVCYSHKDEGHTKDCIVGAAIRAAREG